jgi:RNA polymerase subunit RPABC4/transcription elongation factor Spt4
MIFDPTYISNLVLVLTGFGGAFLAALWLSVIIWTYRDIKSRARDTLVYILATLVVALLSLPGLLIYLVLRPQYTLEEEYQRSLEEEALLQAVENKALCPGCERNIKEEWQVCPNCHTRLKKPCLHCGKLMDLPWNVCPYCGSPELGIRTESIFSVDNILTKKVDIEPSEIENEIPSIEDQSEQDGMDDTSKGLKYS